jgi:CheY-like chemotaxis protein
VLVADGSAVLQRTLQEILRVHCRETLGAGTLAAALRALEERPEIELVLVDWTLPDGEGARLLDATRARPGGGPSVVLLTTHPSPQAERRAAESGALALLAKPVVLRELTLALKRFHERLQPAARRVRATPVGTALLLEARVGGAPVLAWEIEDLGERGAFLRTGGPLPIGLDLPLELRVAGMSARVTARVERVQEPSWKQVGGVAVRFLALTPPAEHLLAKTLYAPGPGPRE